MSCIYGPHQFGTEDQGWVAHFLIRALERPADHALRRRAPGARHPVRRRPGRRVLRARAQHIDRARGQAFNIGGGPSNTISLLELLDLIGEISTTRPAVRVRAPGAPPISATTSPTRRSSASATGWRPQTSASRDGVRGAAAMADDQSRMRPARCRRRAVGAMKFALVNPRWTFEGSIYFGCREPHLPLEYGYAKALLERAGHEVLLARRAARVGPSPRGRRSRRRVAARSRPDFIGGDDGAELSVLAVRAARAARPAGDAARAFARRRHPRSPSVRTRRPHRAATLRKLGADVAVMGECEDVLPSSRGARESTGASIASIAWRPMATLRVQGGHERGRHGGAAGAALAAATVLARHRHHHHRFDAAAGRRRAPRWRRRAAARTTARSARRTTSATLTASARCR